MQSFTLVCLLLAAGSAAALYAQKHERQALDRQVARVLEAPAASQVHTRRLQAEWRLLMNAPERLAVLARARLPLGPVPSGQLVPLAGLGDRLPPPLGTDDRAPSALPAGVAFVQPGRRLAGLGGSVAEIDQRGGEARPHPRVILRGRHLFSLPPRCAARRDAPLRIVPLFGCVGPRQQDGRLRALARPAVDAHRAAPDWRAKPWV